MSTTTGDGEVPDPGRARPDATDATGAASGPDEPVAATRRLAVNEDWAATVLGLVLLALLVSGVVSPDVVP